MPTPGTRNIQDQLATFLRSSRAVFSGGSQPSDKELAKLERDYRKLYERYKSLDADWINKNIPHDHIKAVNFLSLGLSAETAFFGAATQLFSGDANATAIAMAGFAKSRAAYELVNSSKRTDDAAELKELVQLFGSVLGVEVNESFVRSVRTEQMGRILGYALSGLVEDHMKTWNADDGKARREYKGSLEKFLKEMINASDKEAVYAFENALGSDGQYLSGFLVNQHSRAPEKGMRGRNRPDHCFVLPETRNKKGEIEREGVLTIGTSTAAAMADAHGYSFAKTIAAAKAMVLMKTINGEPNPLYGYTVQTFCCLSGNFPTTKLDGTLEDGSALVRMLQSGRASSGAGVTQSQVNLLAQCQFLSFFASPDASPMVIEHLRGINPHILGCDTEDVYEHMQGQSRARADSRELPRWVLNQANKIAGMLAQANVVIDLEGVGQNNLLPLLETIVGISKNHFRSFPEGGSQRVTDQEVRLLENLGKNMGKIYEKLDNTLSERQGELLGQLREEGKRWTSAEQRNERIKADSAWANQRIAPVVHDEELQNSISLMKEFTHSSAIKAVGIGVFKALGDKVAIKAFFEDAFELVQGTTPNGPDLGWDEAFVGQYASAIQHVLSNKTPDNWEGEVLGMETRKDLLIARGRFLKEYPGHPAASLVEASVNILGRQGPGGTDRIRERAEREENTLLEACSAIGEVVIGLARKTEPDSLVAKLKEMRALGKPEKMPAQKRKM